jgi:hypothetical protein
VPRAAPARAWLALALAIALAVVLWGGDVRDIAAAGHPGLGYLLGGWGAYAMIAGGVLVLGRALLPAADRTRRALLGWGITLYLLGTLLAAQVSLLLR